MELSADALVIRFRPVAPAAVLASAQKEHRRSGLHRISVFADTARDGETEPALVQRLLRASELSGIGATGNDKFWRLARAGAVMALPLKFVKDGYDGEQPEHYSIDLGSDPSLAVVEQLMEQFRPERRRDAY